MATISHVVFPPVLSGGNDTWLDNTGATGTMPVNNVWAHCYPLTPATPFVAWENGGTNFLKGNTAFLAALSTITAPPVTVLPGTASINTGSGEIAVRSDASTNVFYHWDGSSWTRYPGTGSATYRGDVGLDGSRSGYILGGGTGGNEPAWWLDLATGIQNAVWSGALTAGGNFNVANGFPAVSDSTTKFEGATGTTAFTIAYYARLREAA